MKKIFIIVLFISKISLAQTFETVIYPRDGYDFTVNYSLIHNSSIYILVDELPIQSSNLLDAELKLLKLDSLGNIQAVHNLNNLIINQPEYSILASRKFFIHNDLIYIYGNIVRKNYIPNPNGYDSYSYLLCLREDLSIKFFKTYLNPDVVTSVASIIPLSNNNQFIATISGYDSNNFYGLYYINPENGQEQFIKALETCGSAGQLLEIPSYNRLHSIQSWPSNSNICSFDLTDYSIADSSGRYLSPNYPRVMPAFELINDSTYLISVTFDKPKNNHQTEFSCHLALQYVKYDLSVIDSVEMQMNKDTTFENFVEKNFDIIDSSHIYWGGSYNYLTQFPIPWDRKTSFLLDKFDYKTKQRIWRKIYKQEEIYVQYKLNALFTTIDKGCLMIGYRWDFSIENNPYKYINKQIYILKVDSMGNNYNEWVNVKKFNHEELRTIYFYPNPNTNRILSVNGLKTGDKLLIYNIQGQLIKSIPAQSKIDLSDLTSGIYILSILSGRGEVIKNEKLVLQ